MTLLSASAHGEAGTVMVLNGEMMSLGAAGGGAAGGALLASGGFHALAVASPVFALATLPLLVMDRIHAPATLATAASRGI